ncbi:unnamed protein product [Arabidopsis arenosa]|uniref:Cytochrome P450 n=1 Tax=Arabidopsis arenosa TaxID=38785 RepID=A0A8S2AE48_ARAAE|nr:unnamed protein product [Arabidopsis arenosa]
MDKVEELVLESETNLGSFAFIDFFPAGLGWAIDRISGQHSRLHKAFARLSNFFQHVIDDHLKPGQSQDHSDIIGVMLDMINKESKVGSFKVTYDHLKGVMSDVFLAGVNAGAITMIWAMTDLPDGMTIADINMEEAGAFVIAKKVPLELVPALHY